MTVTADSRRREYAGNGLTTVFNGPMSYAGTDVHVFLVEDGVSTPVSSSGFAVTRTGRPNGTRITMVTPPAIGQTIVILRTVAFVQDVDITNQGAFLPETIEKGYDALVFQTQQLQDGITRSIRLPDASATAGVSTELPAPQSLRTLVWNASANALENGDTTLTGDMLLRPNLADPAAGASLVQWRQAGVGAVPQTILQELSRVVRPEHFGAVGDGVTDDLIPLQRAVARLASLPTGGTLTLTPGKKYAVSARLDIQKSLGKSYLIAGNGAEMTKTTGGFNGAILYYGATSEATPGGPIIIRDVIFQGLGPNGTGVGLQWAGNSVVENCTFRNFVNGLFLDNVFAMRVCGKSQFLYCSTGAIVASSICHHLTVDSCGFYDNQRDLYFIVGAQAYNLNFVNNDCEGSLGAASNAIVLDAGGAALNISGNYIEGKNGSQLVFGAPVESLTFHANWLGYNSATQAWSNINSCHIEGNIFWDQQQTLAATVKDCDIGANTYAGTSNRIYTPWQAPTLVNGFTNTGAGWAGNVAGFRKDRNGVVHLRGMVQAAGDASALSLPVGYRPSGLTSFVVTTAGGGRTDFARVQVSGGGAVTVFRGADTTADLSGVSFTAQQ